MAFNIKAYHPSRVIKFVEASRAAGDHRVSSRPPVLPTRLHLYNKKPFLGICFKKCQDFSRCLWSTGTFLQIIFIVDNLFNCRGEPLHLNLSIQGRRNRSIASATNPIMPRVDFASPPLFFFSFAHSSHYQRERSRKADLEQIHFISITCICPGVLSEEQSSGCRDQTGWARDENTKHGVFPACLNILYMKTLLIR